MNELTYKVKAIVDRAHGSGKGYKWLKQKHVWNKIQISCHDNDQTPFYIFGPEFYRDFFLFRLKMPKREDFSVKTFWDPRFHV